MADFNSTSTSDQSANINTVLDDNISSTDIANSIKVACSLLEEKKFAVTEPLHEIDSAARVIGKVLKKNVKRFFENNVLPTEDDVILLEEQPDSTAFRKQREFSFFEKNIYIFVYINVITFKIDPIRYYALVLAL